MIWDSIYLSAEQMKALDSASSGYGLSDHDLMREAGRALFREASGISPAGAVAVICGTGNNGGDGYAAARLFLEEGRDVTVIFADAPRSDTAREFAETYSASEGISVRYGDDPSACAGIITDAGVIIDALFGFSFRGQLAGDYAALTELINTSEAAIISADLPSGVYADGGFAPGCVCADVTCTFTVNKPSTVSYPSLEYCGKVVLCDIGVPEEAMEGITPCGAILTGSTLGFAGQRSANSNKGTFGTLLALCGSPNMPGSAYLAACGALRSGVGLLKLSADGETLAILKNRLSEPIFVPFVREILTEQKYTALLVGCGIGRNYDNILGDLLKLQKQITIIDADGINYIASHINVLTEMQGDIILTPHPGEMARLIGETVEYVNANRMECARAFAMEFGCVLVLKGSHTIIASPKGEMSVCPTGNTALAKGGSGDVLAGVIASLAAQGITPYRAACLGVYVHGLAGENLSLRMGAHGVLPHDLPREIGRLLG